MIPTSDQIREILARVNRLTADNSDADAKTSASDQADADATTADAKAAQAKIDKAAADAKVVATLADLRDYVDGLANPAPPAP